MNQWRLKQIEELAIITGMTEHKMVKAFLNSPLLQKKPKLDEKILKFLEIQMMRRVRKPHPFLPAPFSTIPTGPWASPGRIIGGNGPGELFRDPLDSFALHKGFFGPAGSGKTILSLFMTLQAHRQGKPVWWFDTENELTPLLASEPDILFLEVKDLRFNPFAAPPGCDPKDYLHKATSRLREISFFRDRSVNLTRSVALNLLEERGYASISEVYQSLLRMKLRGGQSQRWAEARNTCCDRFAEMLNAWGRIINVRRGHDLRRLLGHSVVWILRDLSDDHLAFLVGFLLLWVENYKGVQYNSLLENIFMFDEVLRVSNISREKRADISEPFFYDFSRTCRKRGVGLVVATQTPSMVPLPILANLSTWYAFPPVDATSARIITNSMGLHPEQLDYFLSLPKEQGRVVVARHPSHPLPFLVSVADLEVNPASHILVQQAVERTRKWLGPVPEEDEVPQVIQNDAIPTAEASPAKQQGKTRKPTPTTESTSVHKSTPKTRPKARQARSTVNAGLKSESAPLPTPPLKPKPKPKPKRATAPAPAPAPATHEATVAVSTPARASMHQSQIPKRNLDYLESIMNEVFLPATKRDSQLEISAWMGNRIRKELEKEGLIKIHKIRTGVRGKLFSLGELQDKAYELLKAMQVKTHHPPGNGSFVHRFWQHTIYQWAVQQGFPAKIENAFDKKRVDIGVKQGKKLCAFEVVNKGLEKELSNLEKDLREGWHQVIFVAYKQKTLDQLERMIKDRYGDKLIREDKVAFRRFKEFLQ